MSKAPPVGIILPTAFIDVVPAGLISLIKSKLKKLFISTVYVAFCLLGLLLSALCQSWHVHLSGFPPSALPGLPLAQLPWQLLLSPELFAFSSGPFPSASLPTAPAREFPPVNKQGFPPLPWEASTPARIAKGQGAAPNLWCPGAPDHSQGRAGSLSYGPGLTLPVTAKSPWILDPAGRSRCSQGSPFPAHREISSTSAWEGWHTNPCSGAQQ